MDEDKFDIDKYLTENIPKENQSGDEEGQDNAGRGSVNPPTVGDLEAHKQAEEEKNRAENISMGVGAGAGAYATHKDLVSRGVKSALAPAKGLYSPKPLLDVAHIGTPAEQYESMVQRMMQSIKDQNKPSGRQMESAHNWESNRQALAKEQNLTTSPGAKRIIVEAGPMAPTQSGVGVPQHVAMAEEDAGLRQLAKQKVDQQLAMESEAKAARTAGFKSGIGKVGLGALGGALGAKDLYDVYQKHESGLPLNEEDYLKIAGGLGGVISTIPTPLTEGVGLTLSGGAMAYPHVKKYLSESDIKKPFPNRKLDLDSSLP